MDGFHPSNRPAENLEAIFTYHPPNAEQRESYRAIRGAGENLASIVTMRCPPCADTSTALRAVREAVMWANAAIALEPTKAEPEEQPLEVDRSGDRIALPDRDLE